MFQAFSHLFLHIAFGEFPFGGAMFRAEMSKQLGRPTRPNCRKTSGSFTRRSPTV